MDDTSRVFRTPAKLAKSTDHHLNLYALAASAAGVTVLAMTSAADAKIVFTPANQRIHLHTLLDLNHDGVNDVGLTMRTYTESGKSVRYLGAFVSRRNLLVGQHSSAYALEAGTVIGPDQAFLHRSARMARWRYIGNLYQGQWINGGKGVKNRYLGIAFVIKGRIHYGWARITVTPGKNFQATLTGYAYETIPKKPIIAGQKHGTEDRIQEPNASLTGPTSRRSTLGMLALGAPALPIWRREEPTPRKFAPN